MQAWYDSVAIPPVATGSTISLTQSNKLATTGATSLSVSLAGVTVGHLLIAYWRIHSNSVPIPTIATTAGTTSAWTSDLSYTTTFTNGTLGLSHATASSTSVTVQSSWGPSADAVLVIYECAGQAATPFDAALSSSTSPTNTLTTPSLTPAGANEFFVAGCDIGFVTGVNAPFTYDTNNPSNGGTAHYQAADALAHSATFVITSGPYNMGAIIGAYK